MLTRISTVLLLLLLSGCSSENSWLKPTGSAASVPKDQNLAFEQYVRNSRTNIEKVLKKCQKGSKNIEKVTNKCLKSVEIKFEKGEKVSKKCRKDDKRMPQKCEKWSKKCRAGVKKVSK